MDLKSIIVQHCSFDKYKGAAEAFGCKGYHDDPNYHFGWVVRYLRFPSADVLFDDFLRTRFAFDVRLNDGKRESIFVQDIVDSELDHCKSFVSSRVSERNICKLGFSRDLNKSGLYLNIARVDGVYVVYEVWCKQSHSDLILARSVPFSYGKHLLEAVIAKDASFVEVK